METKISSINNMVILLKFITGKFINPEPRAQQQINEI